MSFLTSAEIRKLEYKIAAAEALTSAEFKLIICQHAWLGTKRKACKLFKKYGLDQTQDKNAVLLLVIEKDQELLIYGDTGIHEKSNIDHWASVRYQILNHFKENNHYNGLAIGIDMIAENLIEHFPTRKDNINEVSNAIVFA